MMASQSDVIPKARAMKLRSSELSESTITVTNLGEGNVETVFGVIKNYLGKPDLLGL